MTTPKETFTRAEVLQCLRIAWDKAQDTKKCSCRGLHIFRITWKEIDEMHAKHMTKDMEELLDNAVFLMENTFG
jgi:hypothetical protein